MWPGFCSWRILDEFSKIEVFLCVLVPVVRIEDWDLVLMVEVGIVLVSKVVFLVFVNGASLVASQVVDHLGGLMLRVNLGR